MLTFGTVCDGIGCGHLAFNLAGFQCAWSFEIEAFPSAVLAYRFPEVKNWGDMNAARGLLESGSIEAPDVFIGGTPCQAFSVAGKMEGLKDDRGNLSLEFCRIADAIDDVRQRDGKPPCAVLWENVPGVLSDPGNAFGCFLGELSGSGCELQPPGGRWRDAGCVFGPKRTAAWRICDSQFQRVAQRRRRVFVVASAGTLRPEEVLFEFDGSRRDSPPSREAGQGVTHDLAPCVGASGRGFERTGDPRGQDAVVAVVGALPSGGTPKGYGTAGINNQAVAAGHVIPCHPLAAGAHPPAVAFQPRYFTRDNKTGNAASCGPTVAALSAQHAGGDSAPCVVTYDMRRRGDGKVVNTLCTDHAGHPSDFCPIACFSIQERACHPELNAGPGGKGFQEGVAYTLEARNKAQSAAGAMQVRRLLPVETERLQALPDDWTLIPICHYKKKKITKLRPEERLRKDERDGWWLLSADGPRYKGVGNGQTVTVMKWLADRIMRAMTTP